MSTKKSSGLQKPEVEMLAVEALIPYARNARTHSEEQVVQVAASIREFGFTNPVLISADNDIIAGHGRVMAARKLGLEKVPCIRLAHLTETQRRAYVLADNKLALNSGWDEELLKLELASLGDDKDFDLGLIGFSETELTALLSVQTVEGNTDPDEIPEAPAEPVTVRGDVWTLGKHRLMCGDSTSISDIENLMNGQKAQLLHADPPYGMGKEGEGVANDNLYKDKLDDFQREWWSSSMLFLTENSSVYVWGWEHNLCLFYVSVLLPLICENKATHKNWLVWDKKHGQGMSQQSLRRFPPVTEHCLFFAYGVEEYNTNADNYWEGWEPIRKVVEEATKAQGWKVKDLNRITGTQMGGHWVTTSQWAFITEQNYTKLVEAAKHPKAFQPYAELRKLYEKAKKANEEQRNEFYSRRCFFNNSHDAMTDVWHFSRVTGDDRHGHATPKPVEMMERVMKSSLPAGGICLEPFGGSGSTLIGAEKTGRVCYTMELQPVYCDVIVERWQKFTGKEAIHKSGKTFNEMKAARNG